MRSWYDIAMTIIASVCTAALSAAWVEGNAVARIDERTVDFDRRLGRIERTLDENTKLLTNHPSFRMDGNGG
jgi:hypothetical protein